MVTLMMDTDNCSFKSNQKMPFFVIYLSTKGVGMLKDHFLLSRIQLYLCNFSLKCHAREKKLCFKLIFQVFFSLGQISMI